ncbi:MAG: riboflavin synthase [Sphingobacteriia bacterium]|nr:MAG: riboflavin synthase [Sphingobacteriia bacterium]
MFTGIIETLGQVAAIESTGTNKSFWVSSPLASEVKIDQSLAHDGVCLTVDALDKNMHRVTAIEETLHKTNLGHWQVGKTVNLERCLVLNSRLDGHLVQGHVDTTAICTQCVTKDGSWEYVFQFPASFAPLVIEKGSIAVNGTSLTCFDLGLDHFRVAIIPYTYEHTSIAQVVEGSIVNLEFDPIGKYVQRFRQLELR